MTQESAVLTIVIIQPIIIKWQIQKFPSLWTSREKSERDLSKEKKLFILLKKYSEQKSQAPTFI